MHIEHSIITRFDSIEYAFQLAMNDKQRIVITGDGKMIDNYIDMVERYAERFYNQNIVHYYIDANAVCMSLSAGGDHSDIRGSVGCCSFESKIPLPLDKLDRVFIVLEDTVCEESTLLQVAEYMDSVGKDSITFLGRVNGK